MSLFPLRTSVGLLLALTAFAVGAAALGRVTVRYDHPENFSETREVKAFAPTRADNGYLDTLKKYIEQRADKVLADGQQLQVVITDVHRAGSYEPWHGPRMSDVRIVKDIYPPRINLHFRLLDATGAVVREGDRKLRDQGFLTSGADAVSTDSLRYEKNLIDRWLRQGPDKL
jgi:hypothetical protein